jgi:autotransporter-associated beta strand protein
MAGASLTIEGGRLSGGTVVGGAAGGAGSGAGSAFGGGLFLQGNESVTLGTGQTIGQTTTINGVVADQSGSGGSGANAGAGGLVIAGAGTVDLAPPTGKPNTYTGGTTIDSGVLELDSAAAAGSGGIHFATTNSTSGEVEYAVAAVGGVGPNLTNTISGFGVGDAIDFSKVTWTEGDKVVDNGGKVSVETSVGTITVASFQLSVGFSGDLNVGPDGSGGVKVTDPSSTAGVALASPSSISSVSDLLGQYGSELAAQSSFPANDTLGFDAWTALSSSAGVDPDGFGFHGAPNPSGTRLLLEGNLGGVREASSIGIGWNSSTGHGPGPSG